MTSIWYKTIPEDSMKFSDKKKKKQRKKTCKAIEKVPDTSIITQTTKVTNISTLLKSNKQIRPGKHC